MWGITDGPRQSLRDAAAVDVAEQPHKLCLLALQAGRREVCPGRECPLWEEGGCAVERMIAEGDLYTDDFPEEAAGP